MSFFERQARGARTTALLLLCFAGAVLAVILLAYLGVTAGLLLWERLFPLPAFLQSEDGLAWWSGDRFAVVAALTGGGMAVSSFRRLRELRRGGGRVALWLGATPVAAETADPLERRFRNTVEEMAIAAGIPAPQPFVLWQEQAINGFAMGLRPEDAAICITRGALERLDRDELQGVVAHEVAHIRNGDCGLQTWLHGVLYGVEAVGLTARRLLDQAPHQGILVIAALTWAGGALGLFLGRIVQAGVSRTREAMADATAVQLTRSPEGLARALARIEARPFTAQLLHPYRRALSHVFLADTECRGLADRLLRAHPPLAERIDLLDPRGAARSRGHAAAAREARERRAELSRRPARASAWGRIRDEIAAVAGRDERPPSASGPAPALASVAELEAALGRLTPPGDRPPRVLAARPLRYPAAILLGAAARLLELDAQAFGRAMEQVGHAGAPDGLPEAALLTEPELAWSIARIAGAPELMRRRYVQAIARLAGRPEADAIARAAARALSVPAEAEHPRPRRAGR